MSATGLERVAAAFAGSGKRAALMPYMMGGYPSLEDSRAVAAACIEAGADLIELGVPFSDPLADGPVIHAAATAALAGGTTATDVLNLAAEFSARVAIIVMAYANTVLTPGGDCFLARLQDAGVAGLIVPDLPYEEGGELARAASARGLALVPLVAPTTTDARLQLIAARASGFLYVVSVIGTTGERAAARSDATARLIARAKAASAVPVALGFGISDPRQAAAAAQAGADGVIVGSRLVRAAGEPAGGAAEVGRLVAEFATALSPALA
jgi:tryptophan synthase alpha chain